MKQIYIFNIFFAENIHYGSPDLFIEKRLVQPVKLKLPRNLSENENSAVLDILNKWKHLEPFLSSINKHHCTEHHRWFSTYSQWNVINESLFRCYRKKMVYRWNRQKIHRGMQKDVNLTIVEIESLSKGFICCVLQSDLVQFADQMGDLNKFGDTLRNSRNKYSLDF